MPVTTDTDAAVASAAAAIRCLPAVNLSPGVSLDGSAALASAIPGPGSQAVSATLSGDVNGTIVIVVSPELATQIENGPVGPQELVAGLEPALTDAAATISQTLGATRHEAALALDAEVALANAAAYSRIAVVPINKEDGPAGAIVLLLNGEAPKASASDAAARAGAAAFESLSPTATATGATRSVELLNDVEMGVTAELGRTRMTVRELLSIQPGSVVELDRAAGSPVDVLVNGTLVTHGEVVVIDEEFGIRITEIIGYDIKKNAQQ